MAAPFSDFSIPTGTGTLHRSDSGISLKDNSAQKRDKKKAEEDAQFTFHPVIPSRRTADVAVAKTSVGERFENLYKNASKRSDKNTSVEEFTFSPTISAKARSISRDRDGREFIDLMHNSTGSGKVIAKEVVVESFSPKINKRVGAPKASSGIETSDRLYASTTAKKANLEKKQMEKALEEAKECTFAPTVSAKSRSLAAGISDGATVSDRLMQYGVEKTKKREASILAQANKEVVNCTFQPNLITPPKTSNVTISVNSESNSVNESGGSANGRKTIVDNRFEYLYNDAKKRQSGDLNDSIDSECTFSPQISARARSISSTRTITDHASEMYKASGAGRKGRPSSTLEVPSFTPQISKLGKSMDRTRGGSITDHLYSFKDSHEHRLEILKYEAAVKILGDCTFSPQISEKSKALAYSDPSGVVDRLLDYGEEKSRKLQEDQILKAEADMADVTFHPVLYRSTSKGYETETGNQFDRLYGDALKRQVEEPNVRAKYEDLNLTFHPEISGMGKCMDKNRVEEHNQRQKELSQKRKEEQLAQRAQETFSHKPTLSKRASSIDKQELESMLASQKERADKRKGEVAQEMVKENTFAPKIPAYQFKRRLEQTMSPAQFDSRLAPPDCNSSCTSDEQTLSPSEPMPSKDADHKALPASTAHSPAASDIAGDTANEPKNTNFVTHMSTIPRE